jgi:hypothetical protein
MKAIKNEATVKAKTRLIVKLIILLTPFNKQYLVNGQTNWERICYENFQEMPGVDSGF